MTKIISLFLLINTISEKILGQDFIERVIQKGTRSGYQIESIDIDGDGDVDFVIGGGNSIVIMKNDGNLSFSEEIIDTLSYGTFSLSDLDGNDSVDIVTVDKGNKLIRVWFNDEEKFLSKEFETLDSRSHRLIYTADFDLDGDNDILATDWVQEAIVWYDNIGDKVFIGKYVTEDVGETPYFLNALDLDKDGDLDVIVECINSHGGGEMKVGWYENDGTMTFTRHDILNNDQYTWGLASGDLDNDGDLDIITTTNNASDLIMLENDGSQNFSLRQLYPGLINEVGLILEDLDDDNDLDIVIASFDFDKIIVLANINQAQKFIEIEVSNAADGVRWISVGDVNLDGEKDILSASDYDKKFAWYENTTKQLSTYQFDTLPNKFMISEPYPNPFNPSISFDLYIPTAGAVSINVYDVNGRLINEINKGFLSNGEYSFVWNASDQASGVYILQTVFRGTFKSRKLLLLK